MDKYERMFYCPDGSEGEDQIKKNESKINGFLDAAGRKHNFCCEIRRGARRGKQSIGGNSCWVDQPGQFGQKENKHFCIGHYSACEAWWYGNLMISTKWHRISGERRNICGKGLD